MPYEGTSVSLTEMLDILIAKERTESDAALELERAFEDKAIFLLVPDGRSDNDETLYRELSHAERAAVIGLLRQFPNRMKIPSMRWWNAPIDLFAAVRSPRIQFETACNLAEPCEQGSRMTAEQACEALILRLRQGPRMTKVEVYARAKSEIPDLIAKEFDRAWRLTSGDWGRPGRPKTLN